MPFCIPEKSQLHPVEKIFWGLIGFCLVRPTRRERGGASEKAEEEAFPTFSLPLLSRTRSLSNQLYRAIISNSLVFMTSFRTDLVHFWAPLSFLPCCPLCISEARSGMVKKARVNADASLSTTSCYQVGNDARARLRFLYLMREYEELQKETEAKKRNLQKAKEKKLRLLAEVKFLKKKYKSFLENPTQTTLCRLKEQSHKMSSICSSNLPAKQPIADGVLSKGSDHRVVEASKPRAAAMLDLNQVSLPVSESDEFQIQMEAKPLNSELQDHNLAICLDAGNKSNRFGNKRKVRWVDQITPTRNFCVDA